MAIAIMKSIIILIAQRIWFTQNLKIQRRKYMLGVFQICKDIKFQNQFKCTVSQAYFALHETLHQVQNF